MPRNELVLPVPLEGNFAGQSLFDASQFDPISLEVFYSAKAEMAQSIRDGQIPQLLETQVMCSAFSNYKVSSLTPIRFAFESGFIRLGGPTPLNSGELPTTVGKTFDHHIINGIGIHGPDVVVMGHRSKAAVRRAIGILTGLRKPMPIIDVIALEKMGLVDSHKPEEAKPAAMALLKLVLPYNPPSNKML